eukprot:1151475-Pelagomonas_calceolata.AAC.4
MSTAVAAGRGGRRLMESPLYFHWQQLEEAADLLGSAPDDEVSAEILALQSELVQQVRGISWSGLGREGKGCKAIPVPNRAAQLKQKRCL